MEFARLLIGKRASARAPRAKRKKRTVFFKKPYALQKHTSSITKQDCKKRVCAAGCFGIRDQLHADRFL